MQLEIPDIPEELADKLREAAEGIAENNADSIVICVVSTNEQAGYSEVWRFTHASNGNVEIVAGSLIEGLLEKDVPEKWAEHLRTARDALCRKGIILDEIGATKGSA